VREFRRSFRSDRCLPAVRPGSLRRDGISSDATVSLSRTNLRHPGLIHVDQRCLGSLRRRIVVVPRERCPSIKVTQSMTLIRASRAGRLPNYDRPGSPPETTGGTRPWLRINRD